MRQEVQGIFEKYGIYVLETPIQAIFTTEDRELFAKAVAHYIYKVAESACFSTVDDAAKAARAIAILCLSVRPLPWAA